MPSQKTQLASLLLALVCSLLTGVSQLLIKGAAEQAQLNSWWHSSTLLLIVLSYGLLGVAFVFYLLALRDGALSTIYPILAARYVWVVAIAPFFFASESLNTYKIAGAVLAALGVTIVATAGVRVDDAD